MVYILGGAFIMGGGASYFFAPNFLIEQVRLQLKVHGVHQWGSHHYERRN
jgi:carboxylesterase type B